jgi:hypothetical protein
MSQVMLIPLFADDGLDLAVVVSPAEVATRLQIKRGAP